MTEHKDSQQPQDLLSVGDVACRLGISIGAIYNLIRDGDLLAYNMARHLGAGERASYRIPRQSLDEFLARRIMPRGRLPVSERRRRTHRSPPAKDHLRL
jgi:excisionase family DNA binding protein